jgi:hypothetical protein
LLRVGTTLHWPRARRVPVWLRLLCLAARSGDRIRSGLLLSFTNIPVATAELEVRRLRRALR